MIFTGRAFDCCFCQQGLRGVIQNVWATSGTIITASTGLTVAAAMVAGGFAAATGAAYRGYPSATKLFRSHDGVDPAVKIFKRWYPV